MPDDDYDDSASEKIGRDSVNGRENDSRGDSDTDDNDSDDDMDDESGDGKHENAFDFCSILTSFSVLSDTDESKSRMPEHEAAQLLLSLSNHAGSASSSQASLIQQQITSSANWNEQVDNHLEAITRNRVIMSTLKAGDFDLLNHESTIPIPT